MSMWRQKSEYFWPYSVFLQIISTGEFIEERVSFYLDMVRRHLWGGSLGGWACQWKLQGSYLMIDCKGITLLREDRNVSLRQMISRWAGFPFLDSTQRRIIFNWILGSQTGPVFFLKSDVLHCWSISMDHLKSISLCSFSNSFLHRGHKKPRLAHRERWAVWSADRWTISNYFLF